MNSIGAADLPIIKYSLLKTRDANGNRTGESLVERHNLYSALKNLGFAYLQHPGTSQEKVDKLFSHSQSFFAKPQAEKMQILGQMDKGRGPSQGFSCPARLAADPKTSDIKEFFGMYRDDDLEKPNQWLRDPESVAMRHDLVAFFEDCHLVILELLSALAEEIGLPQEALHPSVSEKNHFIASLFYPAAGRDMFAKRVRSAAHTDYGCLTLLFNDNGEGLQVMNKSGDYEYVHRVDGCAVVNVGDLLSRFFNGSLPSTMHRVIEPPVTADGSSGNIGDRYSLAFFAHFNTDILVKPLNAACSESQPPQFEPVLAGEHVKARVRQLHVAGHSLRESRAKPVDADTITTAVN